MGQRDFNTGRRSALAALFGSALTGIASRAGAQTPAANAATAGKAVKVDVPPQKIEKLVLSEDEWKKRLTPEQYNILRREGTERAGTSPLNDEKRAGVYHCAGCDLALFTSDMKYDSGTGWPSFFTTLPGVFETKTDFKLIYPRTEYHCARCGGHHGHVFNDGPKPTGQRWCNNGLALKFKPV
ncbi:MAG: peptide-methionine (R)-S-oxide reductase MsrB [Burkholderiales bacterium]|nr:peptide-methionine (R)-S-oxide reductase MsrB [Burkholderiales bacterium]